MTPLIPLTSPSARPLQVSQRAHYSSEDGQWSEGLISAARTVAVATHSLCQAANSLVQGHSSEELLISAAKQVNGLVAAAAGGSRQWLVTEIRSHEYRMRDSLHQAY